MWKDFLALTKNEQRGMVVLTTLILILLIVRLIMPVLHSNNGEICYIVDTLSFVAGESDTETLLKQALIEDDDLLNFDPNTVTMAQLQSLGLNNRIASNWQRYIESGGSFKNPEDVKKIYGMTDELYLKIKPYMKNPLSDVEDSIDHDFKHYSLKKSASSIIDLNNVDSAILSGLLWSRDMIDSVFEWRKLYYLPDVYTDIQLKNWNLDSLNIFKDHNLSQGLNSKRKTSLKIEINMAGADEWQMLYGIGPVLSERIVKYRKALGGFVTTNQLAEVYGISQEVFKDMHNFLYCEGMQVETININSASVSRLRSHPYLDFYEALAIVESRKTKGKYNKVEDVRNVLSLEDDKWNLLKHYLSIEDK